MSEDENQSQALQRTTYTLFFDVSILASKQTIISNIIIGRFYCIHPLPVGSNLAKVNKIQHKVKTPQHPVRLDKVISIPKCPQGRKSATD